MDSRSNGFCNSGLCRRLAKISPGTIIDVILSGERYTNLTFLKIDSNTDTIELFDGGTDPLIVSCNKLDAFQIVSS